MSMCALEIAAARWGPGLRRMCSHVQTDEKEEENTTQHNIQLQTFVEKEQPAGFVVCAIDFGTAFSAWGFSFRDTFLQEPLDVALKDWIGEWCKTKKVPTSVLIESDGKTLKAFGYEAQSEYGDLQAQKGQRKTFYYFHHFKMRLWDKGWTRDHLDDFMGKQLPAITVFALSLKFLKDDMLAEVRKQFKGPLNSDDIRYVITVPAIWNDVSKRFMREAAEQAGIPSGQLTLALEPEAASIYCHRLPMSREENVNTLSSLKHGEQYVTLDAGGGTVDYTVHEILENGHMREIHRASGGAWGGVSVNDAFEDFLKEIFGSEIIGTMKTEEIGDYMRLCERFEIVKHKITPENSQNENLYLPGSLMKLVEEKKNQTISEVIQESRYSNKIRIKKEQMSIGDCVIKQFFNFSLENIVSHLQQLLNSPVCKEVKTIVLVGGYSQSTMLQKAIETEDHNCRVIVPENAQLAVLKGAVVFGHDPSIITQRISKFTYGTDISLPFDINKHSESKRTIDKDGKHRVHGVFVKMVEIDQVIVVNEEIDSFTFAPVFENQTKIDFAIYQTEDVNPKYVTDDGCEKIGDFSFPLQRNGRQRNVNAKITFGGTEIKLKLTRNGSVSNYYQITNQCS